MKVTVSVVALLISFGLAQTGSVQESNKQLVETFFTVVLNEGNIARADEFIAPDYTQHNPMVPQGLEGFVAGLALWRGAFPDYRSSINDIIAEGDKVWVWHTATGTHVNDYFDLAATGNTFELDVLDIFVVQDGKLTEHWDIFYFSVLTSQLLED
ncbi:MAG: ester cyclase [Deinococcota bacterium]